MELEHHDRLISYVLGLSHALNIAFFTALANSGDEGLLEEQIGPAVQRALGFLAANAARRVEWLVEPELKGANLSAINLKGVDLSIPLGLFTCVTGVSGSGKSTLAHAVADRLRRDLSLSWWQDR